VGLSAGVLVSSKVKTFQEAYQLSGLVVLPIVMLVLAQASGVLFLGPLVAFVLGLVLWVIAIALIALAVGVLQRNELIAKL
jgi:Na+-transporting NADH:ubiquinone oxidoreductase subunit NqrD